MHETRIELRTKFLSVRHRRLFLSLLALSLALPYFGCVKRSRDPRLAIKANSEVSPQANDQQSGNSPQSVSLPDQSNKRPININTAAAGELEKLPGIGKGLAQRIIDHRERFGPFRRPEHLIIVRGISDKRFRALRDLVTVE